MKRYLTPILVVFTFLFLAGCASHRYPYLNKNLAHEGWMRYVDADPNMWTRGSDNWFMTGDPNATEMADRNAPYSAAISTMSVHVPEFVNLKTNGDFQVQLFGTYEPNSVFVYGPNEAVRSVVIEVRGNTLCISMAKNAPRSIRKVIIRIGVNQLNNLLQLGCGPIEGIQLHSNSLSITSMGKGNIYLAGPMNLTSVMARNSGSVTVLGARTPWLEIKTSGAASVNVSGEVGVRKIIHHGVGNINIIGANSDSLKIYADGRGKVGIRGHVNLREVRAKDKTGVFVCNANSNSLYTWASDDARIGMSGTAENLYVDATKRSRFEGRSLCVTNAYVRAHDVTHINVSASNKIFASATESASVYFFGSPNMMSQYVNGLGVVIPVWSENSTICPVATVAPVTYSYKGENISSDNGYTPASYSNTSINPPQKQSGYPHSQFKWVNKKLQGEG